jgi:hypothetical protein
VIEERKRHPRELQSPSRLGTLLVRDDEKLRARSELRRRRHRDPRSRGSHQSRSEQPRVLVFDECVPSERILADAYANAGFAQLVVTRFSRSKYLSIWVAHIGRAPQKSSTHAS